MCGCLFGIRFGAFGARWLRNIRDSAEAAADHVIGDHDSDAIAEWIEETF